MNKISRRQFLKFTAAAAGGALVACARLANTPGAQALADAIETKVFLPLVNNAEPAPTSTPTPVPTVPPPPTGARVVHTHASSATHWDGSDPHYWNYVDQGMVNQAIDRGLLDLTGTSSVSAAWLSILPNYKAGQGIAIKVSFNNSTNCQNTAGLINSTIHPANAVIRGLKSIGVRESDIWIYDAIRSIPDYYVNGCLYNGALFYDNGCRNPAGWNSSDPNSYVTYHPTSGIPAPKPVKITDVLMNATYLINMPIMKRHSGAGVSLALKNHFGSIKQPGNLHDYIDPSKMYFSSKYSPIVDLNLNPNIKDKTILTIGDGLFASKVFNGGPSPWATFNNQVPNSFFFSNDPVAIDCVMADFLAAEMDLITGYDYYLPLAANAGLGVYERGNPWGTGYKVIDYHKVEL